MKGYIKSVLKRYQHTPPKKPQLSTHLHTEPTYGENFQFAKDPVGSDPLNESITKSLQCIISVLLIYSLAVNNRIICALSTIALQVAETQDTKQAVQIILDYVPTYTNDGICYRKSGMKLVLYADAC